MRNRERRGFTLIEMLVVLAILAALSLVALRSTAGLADRGRFEATVRTLDAVQSAILGTPPGSASSLPTTIASGGFLADCGRLPDFSNPDPTLRLTELWQQPVGMTTNAFAYDVADVGDPEIVLACGWRGPYLQLPIGIDPSITGKINDGFGNALIVQDAGSRWQVVSTGADGMLGLGSGYDADLAVTLSAGVESAEVSGTVHVLVGPTSGVWEAEVFAFEPDPITGGMKSAVPQDGGAQHFDSTTVVLPTTFNFKFISPGLTPGPRVLRAYVLGAHERKDAPYQSRIYSPVLLHGAQTLDLTIDITTSHPSR